MSNYFTELNKIDVSKHVEKKGRFSYLSWVFAVEQLRKNHPDATWRVERFDGKPFMNTELGYFVEVAVTVEGVELSQIHPVLDNRNKPVEKPNPFQINTSIQRALVKAIALHGLGLYIYGGEDLPTDDSEPKQQSAPKPKTSSLTQQSEIERKAKEYVKIQKTGTVSALMEFLKISDIKLISENHAKVSIKKLDEIIAAAKKKQEADTLKELQE